MTGHDNSLSVNLPVEPEKCVRSTDREGGHSITKYSTPAGEYTASIEHKRAPAHSDCEPTVQLVKRTPSTLTAREPLDLADALPTPYAITNAGAGPPKLDPSAKYAKRSRHKTKPDTYDYKGATQAPRRMRKRKRGGDSLGNDHFHAANVDAERVTLKPSSSQPFFGQGGTSLPLPGQDLPDLTFTRMSFLSRPPQNAQTKPTQARMKDEIGDYIVQRNRKQSTIHSIPTENSHNQSITSKSRPYSTRFAMEREPDIRACESLSSNNDAQSTRRTIDKPSWVRNESELRVEEFWLPNTSLPTNTPLSWSTSPSRDIACAAGAKFVQRDPRSLADGQHAEFTGQVEEPESHRAWSIDPCEKLTQRLLSRGHSTDVATYHQYALKDYKSLEDLKRISEQTSGKGSSHGVSALQPPIRARKPFSSGQKSQSAPSCVHGPPLYGDDVIMQQCDLTHTPIRQDQIETGFIHQDKHVLYGRLDSRVQDLDWCTASAHVTKQRWMPTVPRQGNQRDRSTKHVIALPPLTSASPYTTTLKPSRLLHAASNDCTYGSFGEQRLDDFDLDLLETAKMAQAAQDFHLAGTPRLSEAEVSHLMEFGAPAAVQNGTTGLLGSFSVRPSAELRLLRKWDDMESQIEEAPGLRLDRPSLQCSNTKQEFNPFRRSCGLL